MKTSGSTRGGPMAVALLMAAACFARPASADEWTTYANPNNIKDIVGVDGVLWMATTGGALRFDPATSTFQQFGRRVSGGPSSQDLTGVCRDDSGLLYFGSSDRGVVSYDPVADRWSRFDEVPSNEIQGISCLDGDIYIATANGFAIRRSGTEICNDIDRGCCGNDPENCDFPSFDVRDFGRLGTEIWAATAGGPAEFANGKWTARRLGGDVINARSIEAFNGAVFLATPNALGVFRWNPDTGQWVDAAQGLRPGQGLGDLARLVVSSGTLYLCAGYGLFEWNGGGWFGTGLEDVTVRSVTTFDSPGFNLYAVTDRGLRARRDVGPTTMWSSFPAPGPPLLSAGQAVDAAPDGTVWIGTLGGVMKLGLDGAWSAFGNGQNGLLPSDVFSIFADSRNRLWVGKCCCFNPPECPTQVIDNGSVASPFLSVNGWAMAEDNAGRLWVGSNTNGVYALGADGSEIVNLTQSNTAGVLRSNSVRAVAADGPKIWIGHENAGLQILRTAGHPETPGGFTWLSARQLPELSVVGIALEGSDAWVLTSANLSRYRDDIKFEQHSLTPDGEPRSGRALAVDKRGNKWMATSGGALRLSKDGTLTVFNTVNSDLIDDNVLDVAVDPKTGDVLFETTIGTSRLRPGAEDGGGPGTGLFLHPNPFRPGLVERVKVGGGTADNALVTDLAGRAVARFDPSAGWDGRGDDGERVTPGIYMVVVDGDHVLRLAVLR